MAEQHVHTAIRGGTLVDGTGEPPRRADVGITNGRIIAIDSDVRGDETIDATGLTIAPGFLDIHTHYDPQVLWDPRLSPSCWHGVTSVVAGNCGFSVAPALESTRATLLRTLDKVEDIPLAALEAGVRWDFETYPDYLDAVRRRGTAVNFGGYIGHTALRLYAMGDAAYEREASEAEVETMRGIVADALRHGALGFSTDRAGFILGDGGRVVPSVRASQAETEALMRVPAEVGIGTTHIAPGENYQWLYDFQRSTGGRINWSSILTYPPSVTSRAPWADKLARHEAERRAGADVWVQVTCRPIVQLIQMIEPTPFGPAPAFAELLAAAPTKRASVYADPAWRARAAEELDSGKWVDPRWNTLLVAESDVPGHEGLLGRSVADIAAARGCHPIDVMCDVAIESSLLARFSVTFANDDTDGVTALLQGDGCILGLSDAGAHSGQICDAVLPTDFLSTWVRDRQLVPLERGVRKLTGELADVLGIDRGYVRLGAPADLVLFDLDALGTGPIRRVADLPAGGDRLTADQPTGIEYVIVNGVPIVRNGRDVVDELASLPGAILTA